MPATSKSIVIDIPLLDSVAFLLESPESPKHVSMLQVFKAPKGKLRSTIDNVVDQFRESDVAAPFHYAPVFPRRSLPKWADAAPMDMNYHVRRAAVPQPGTEQQLLDLITELHIGVLDRHRPCWIAYIIEGLENNQFAVFWKVHHAYIDGASGVMRMDASLSKSARSKKAVPMWAPLFEPSAEAASDEQPWLRFFRSVKQQQEALQEVRGMLRTVTWRSSGFLGRNEAPLPFTAPRASLNAPVTAERAFGVGSLPLTALIKVAKQHKVSVNELVLALVGDSLEHYMQANKESLNKPLVAACPMNVREAGNTDATTQIAAITIKLGEPGADLEDRLKQVRESSVSAKEDAASMSRNGLIDYLAVIGGTAELLDRSRFRDYLPPLTNVNVSNVPGPREQRYLCGAKLVRNIPVSTLVGGSAINITFFSVVDRMEYGVVSDANSVPGADVIAAGIADAFERLS